MKTFLGLFLLTLVAGCSTSPYYQPTKLSQSNIHSFEHHVEDIFLPSLSDNLIHLQMHYSPISNNQLLVHFHGNAGNISETVEKVEWLLDYGYDILLVDYSGYGMSEGKANKSDLRKDAASVLFYASELSPQRYSRKILLGTSMGGAIVLDGLNATNLESEFDLLIIDSSFDNYRTLASNVVSNYPMGSVFSAMVELILPNWNSPSRNMSKLNEIPVLVAHCDGDTLIPLERGLELYNYAHTNSQFWQLKDCKHARTFTDEHPQNQTALVEILNAKGNLNSVKSIYTVQRK